MPGFSPLFPWKFSTFVHLFFSPWFFPLIYLNLPRIILSCFSLEFNSFCPGIILLFSWILSVFPWNLTDLSMDFICSSPRIYSAFSFGIYLYFHRIIPNCLSWNLFAFSLDFLCFCAGISLLLPRNSSIIYLQILCFSIGISLHFLWNLSDFSLEICLLFPWNFHYFPSGFFTRISLLFLSIFTHFFHIIYLFFSWYLSPVFSVDFLLFYPEFICYPHRICMAFFLEFVCFHCL